MWRAVHKLWLKKERDFITSQKMLIVPVHPSVLRRVAFLPFVRVCLKALRKKPFDFEPKTLGAEIKKERLKRGLSQKELGNMLNVTSFTVLNWEKGKTEPHKNVMPKVKQLIGAVNIPFSPANE